MIRFAAALVAMTIVSHSTVAAALQDDALASAEALRPSLGTLAAEPAFVAAEASLHASVEGDSAPNRQADDERAAARERISPQAICDAAIDAAAEHELPVVFFIRLIWQESRFNPQAISRAGAQGVAQFMPRVAQELGLEDPFDPQQALPMSARLLRTLHGKFGSWGLAAAAYNAGARRVREWLDKRGKLPKETRDYVHTITGYAAERWVKPGTEAVAIMPPKRVPCVDLPSTELHMVGTMVPIPPRKPGSVAATRRASDEEISAARRKPAAKCSRGARRISQNGRPMRALCRK